MSTASADLFTAIAGDLPNDVAWATAMVDRRRAVGGGGRRRPCLCRALGRPSARPRMVPSRELYGLRRRAPYARLDEMGAAFVLARSGHRVVAIDADAINVGSATGSRLRIFGRRPESVTVLAWEVCGSRALSTAYPA